MRIVYADPPYLGCCGLYDHHHPDAECWDDRVTHEGLTHSLAREYDGWLLHLSVPSLPTILDCLRPYDDWRVMAWVKPFAAFKANVPVVYVWEPIIVKPCRTPVVAGHVVMRDWIAAPMTLRRGLTGAKPEAVCRWAFEVLGMTHDDELIDLFPGTGAVTRAWERWRNQLQLDFRTAR